MKLSAQAGLAAIVLLIIGGLLFAIGGLVSINPGEIGLKVKMVGTDRGMEENTMNTGLQWVNPITYDVPVYDVRCKQYDMADTTAETKDGQPIELDISFEICLIDKEVPNLHETVGKNWYEEIVYPAARTATRFATSDQVSALVYTNAGRVAIRDSVDLAMAVFADRGIKVSTNVRNLKFLNKEFTNTLEEKSIAGEREEIETRLAAAAVQSAIKVANIAEGAKQKSIKESEARAAKIKLEGEGSRDRDIAMAEGNLALAQASAEGTRLQVMAYGNGETYASVKWAESIGDNIQVYGVPVGAEGTTSIMDLTGALSGMAKLNGK
jgi:regulator of protease activity HflC (stomatin/prohibitin superfamily)